MDYLENSGANMRPLNRPMFKMGGPIKEGIMQGMKEPQAINTVDRDWE